MAMAAKEMTIIPRPPTRTDDSATLRQDVGTAPQRDADEPDYEQVEEVAPESVSRRQVGVAHEGYRAYAGSQLGQGRCRRQQQYAREGAPKAGLEGDDVRRFREETGRDENHGGKPRKLKPQQSYRHGTTITLNSILSRRGLTGVGIGTKIACNASLFVFPANAGIHVPTPGFRLGGRNDG